MLAYYQNEKKQAFLEQDQTWSSHFTLLTGSEALSHICWYIQEVWNRLFRLTSVFKLSLIWAG